MKLTDEEKELVERAKRSIEASSTTLFSPQYVEKLLTIIARCAQEPDQPDPPDQYHPCITCKSDISMCPNGCERQRRFDMAKADREAGHGR